MLASNGNDTRLKERAEADHMHAAMPGKKVVGKGNMRALLPT